MILYVQIIPNHRLSYYYSTILEVAALSVTGWLIASLKKEIMLRSASDFVREVMSCYHRFPNVMLFSSCLQLKTD